MGALYQIGEASQKERSLDKSSKGVEIDQASDRFTVLPNEIRHAADPSIQPCIMPCAGHFDGFRRDRKIGKVCLPGQVVNDGLSGNVRSMLPKRSIQGRGQAMRFVWIDIHRRRDCLNSRAGIGFSSGKCDGNLRGESLHELHFARKFGCEGRTGLRHRDRKVRRVLDAAPCYPIGEAERDDSFAKRVTERTIEVTIQNTIEDHRYFATKGAAGAPTVNRPSR